MVQSVLTISHDRVDGMGGDSTHVLSHGWDESDITPIHALVGFSGVVHTVLRFPGLVKYSEGLLCSVPAQVSPPTPLGQPWKVLQPGRPPGRTVLTGRASS